MFIVNSYALAVVLCFVTMLCWGSWGNTQKLAAKSWRYELFYWDYVIGMVLFALLLAFTAGSIGSQGRPFLQDLAQASWSSILWILVGGIIFNASNILLSASVSLAGMAVAFPLGVGIALVLGVVNNYRVAVQQGSKTGNVLLLAIGVLLVVCAIVFNGMASARKGEGGPSKDAQRKGVILALIAGVVMSFFSSFVMRAMDTANFVAPAAGKVTPYTAIVIFTLGVLLSNFLFNTIVMRKPFVGEPVSYGQYFKGNFKTHLVGVLGGCIWCLGTSLSYITAEKAGPAVSYALGQGAPMIAAIWGVFIWKEFKGAKKGVYGLLIAMFCFFVAGLATIIVAGN
ncbi:MAG: multidrug DMT transporter permease [Bacteroidales bacterium]|nr:multidrug DMT transporter permease [Bacteroidales bacterium]